MILSPSRRPSDRRDNNRTDTEPTKAHRSSSSVPRFPSSRITKQSSPPEDSGEAKPQMSAGLGSGTTVTLNTVRRPPLFKTAVSELTSLAAASDVLSPNVAEAAISQAWPGGVGGSGGSVW